MSDEVLTPLKGVYAIIELFALGAILNGFEELKVGRILSGVGWLLGGSIFFFFGLAGLLGWLKRSKPHVPIDAEKGVNKPQAGVVTPEILAMVEPMYHTVQMGWKNGEQMEWGDREVFAAKVRNQGTRSIYVDTIGFTVGQTKYVGRFTPYGVRGPDDLHEIQPGHFQVFSFYGVEIEMEQFSKLDGMYVVTGSGHDFVNNNVDLKRLIRESSNTEEHKNREEEIKAVRDKLGELLTEGNRLLRLCRKEDEIRGDGCTFTNVPYTAEPECFDWDVNVVEILRTQFGESYVAQYHTNLNPPETQSTSSALTQNLHARLTELQDLIKNEQRWPANLRPL